jgi:hypothetical protein
MASKPSWFLSPRVATYVTWRCILANHMKFISRIHTAKFVETKMHNQKGETVKKPKKLKNITDLCKAWIEQTTFYTTTHTAGKQ